MKRNIIFGALACTMLCAGAFALTACGDKPEPDKGCGAFGKYVSYHLNPDEKSYTIQLFSGEKIQSYNDYEAFLRANARVMSISDALIIPETYNGKPVTAISPYAFVNCSFSKVVLPDSIKTVGWNAFADCQHLTSVTLGESVETVGWNAFEDCYKLVEVYNKSDLTVEVGKSDHGAIALYAKDVYTQSYESKLSTDEQGYVTYTGEESKTLIDYVGGKFNVTIPDGVTDVDAYAFVNYAELLSVRIPQSLKSIRPYAFFGCNKMERVYVDSLDVWCKLDFAEANANPLYYAKELYVDGEILSELSITTQTPTLKNYAFYGCQTLTSVTLGEGVTALPDGAFSWCSQLETVTLPSTLKSIGNSVFSGCKQLKILTLPTHLETIGDGAFTGSGLTEIILPDSVNTLGRYAFNGCKGLKTAVIGGGIESIPKESFYDCSALESVQMQDGVGFIDEMAFANCSALKTIRFPNQLKYVGSSAFFSCKKLTELVLPDSVAIIDRGAFEYCEGVTRVVLGSRLHTVGAWAFYGCLTLDEVFYNGTKTAWQSVSVSTSNENLTEATVYFYSETPQTDGNFWYYEQGEIKKW